MQQKTLTKALMDQFGKKPGQSLQEFQAEIKTLTEKDRADFTAMFAGEGIEIIAGAATKAA